MVRQKLPGPYLLVSHIPCTRVGDRWCVGSLWAKDLLLHLPYIDGLVLAAPSADQPSKEAAVELPTGGPGAALRVVPLVRSYSVGGAVLRLPSTVLRLWKAIGEARIVHCGIGGWPISYGWIAAPLARLRGRFLVVIVESAFWREWDAGAALPREPLLRRLRYAAKRAAFERLGRWCVRLADAAFFTQREYLDSFRPRNPDPEHIFQASWIDAGDILTDSQAADNWRAKTDGESRPLRLLFAGRLSPEKGVEVLLAAVRELRLEGVGVELDILGAGSLEPAFRLAAEQPDSGLRMLGTVAYGPEFFGVIRAYDALVVPSLSDEQPRVVYDAFSQGVPVLGSATAGIRECVEDGRNGLLFAPRDVGALAACIRRAAGNRRMLVDLGRAGLASARANTHQGMHQRRFELIKRALARRGERVGRAGADPIVAR